jgi:hypothetical protein
LGGNGLKNPVTFAEYVEEPNGKRRAVEPFLHNEED